MANSFFKKTDKDSIVFSGDGELIYYVPEKYFENQTAIINGEITTLMGVFSYAVFDKSGKRIVFKPFNCPTMVQCRPYKIEKESNYHLEGTHDPQAYRFLYFKDGDELLCSIHVPKDVDNVENFVKLLTGGHLPDSIPYDEVQNYITENADLNKFNYKVNNQVIGMLISELYRDRKDLTKPFRLSGMEDMLAYKAIRIEDGPKYTSPFTAVTSDNADEAIAAAITVAGNGKSPLEKVMMG